MEYHKKAMLINETIFGKNNPKTTKSYNSIAIQLRQRDQFDEAIAYYRKVETIRLKHYGEEHLLNDCRNV